MSSSPYDIKTMDKKTLDELGNPKTNEELFKKLQEHNAAHGGGSRSILYKECGVMAPMCDILMAIETLNAMAVASERQAFIRRVERSMERSYPKMMKQKASQRTAMNFMHDVVIWFANEVIEGRQTLEVN